MIANIAYAAALISAALTIFLTLQLVSSGRRRQALYAAIVLAASAVWALNLGDQRFSLEWIREAKYQPDGVALIIITSCSAYAVTFIKHARAAHYLHLYGGAIVGMAGVLGGLATLGVTRNSEALGFAAAFAGAALIFCTGGAGLWGLQRPINTRIIFGFLAVLGACQIVTTLVLLVLWKTAA